MYKYCKDSIRRERGKNRGDNMEVWDKRDKVEDEMFKEWEREGRWDWKVE